MKVTTVRLALKAGVPLKRPLLNISRFSGSNGLTSGGTLSQWILTLVPRPPRWSSIILGSVSTRSMFPLAKSISKLYPVSAYLIFYHLSEKEHVIDIFVIFYSRMVQKG
jgi:hypothetical protein